MLPGVQMGLDPKDEWTLDDWVGRIAREEGGGCEETEAALRAEFLDWETRSKSAPNGKWRGANSRKWGKVGIEMRLTGSVPRTNGPVTQLGRMVCKFVDVVEAEAGRAVLSPARPLGVSGGGGKVVTPRGTEGSGVEDRQVRAAAPLLAPPLWRVHECFSPSGLVPAHSPTCKLCPDIESLVALHASFGETGRVGGGSGFSREAGAATRAEPA